MTVPAFERQLNLLIGFPSNGNVHPKFTISLTNMMSYLMAQKVEGYRNARVVPLHTQGSILPRSRMQIVKTALEQNCTHLLFIDTDQRFPKDTAHRLLQWRKHVIACNIATKQTPANPTARVRGGDNPDGLPLYSNPGQAGLEKVWRVGTGVMLVDMQVFRKIGLGVFEIRWVPEIQDYRGEDWNMCSEMERAGYDIWIDHELSQEVGHLGDFDYTHEWIVDNIQVRQRPEFIGERA